jgi:hypothetical protein
MVAQMAVGTRIRLRMRHNHPGDSMNVIIRNAISSSAAEKTYDLTEVRRR